MGLGRDSLLPESMGDDGVTCPSSKVSGGGVGLGRDSA